MAGRITRDAMIAAIGQELGLSRWFTIDQPLIDRFADVTQDHQFIHVDPARAAQTPFGGTVAHGMLTLSMISAMADDVLPQLEGQDTSINYGLERVRFPAPVRAGARLRGRFTLSDAKPRARSALMAHLDVTVEIEGEARPALSAQWLVLYTFKTP
ncbi:MAG: MaoC family dehydratase [Sulfitobacter sp.]